jgi:hypothetical protein
MGGYDAVCIVRFGGIKITAACAIVPTPFREAQRLGQAPSIKNDHQP